MTIAVGVVVALVGIVLIIGGLGMFAAFRLGLHIFDRSLRSDLAGQGKEQVELAVMKIKNPRVRQFVLQRLVTSGGTMAISMARGALQSRMRLGLVATVAGVVMLIAAFFTGRWLPLLWPA